MKTLVTGASGFVGRQLCKSLALHNVESILVKRVSNREGLNGNCFYVKGIDGSTCWQGAFEDVECVIHCAARVHLLNDAASDPLEVFREVNVYGTMNLAKAASEAGVKRFVFVSSIKVNGEGNDKAYTAFDKPKPEDPYGISKFQAEEQLKKLASKSSMDVVIIRPPLVYGPGVKANFAAMLKLASTGLPLPFSAIKHNRRSMVSVFNLVSLIVTCIGHPNAGNNTFLVSDDDDFSTAQFVTQLQKALGKRTFNLPVPVSIYHLFAKVTGKHAIVDRVCGNLILNIEHTKTTLDWKPPKSVKESFSLTAQNFIK